MNLVQKISYNFFISAGARVISLALAFVSLGFITRALGVDGYGQYALILAFLSFFQILADFGLQALMIKEMSLPAADEKNIVSNFFTLRFVISIVFLMPAPLAVLFFPYGAAVKTGVALVLVGYIFFSLSQLLQGVFQKYLKIERYALAEFSGRLAQLGLFYLGYIRGYGLFWFLEVFVISSAIIFFSTLFFSKKYAPFSLKFNFSYWGEIIKKAAPIAVSLLFTFIYFKIDTLMLGAMKNEQDVGIYNLAYKVLEIAIAFPAIFVGLVLPLLSSAITESQERFKKIFKNSFFILLATGIAALIIGWILAPLIIKILGGDDFLQAIEPLRILLISAFFIFLGTLLGQVIIILDQQKKAAFAYGFGAVFNVITNFIFIPRYSYLGAAGTTVATEILVTAVLAVIVLTNFKRYAKI